MGTQTYRSMNPMFSKTKNSRYNIKPTVSQIQRNRRTLKPFTEMIASRKVAVDGHFNNVDNHKKMPYHNTRVLQTHCQTANRTLIDPTHCPIQSTTQQKGQHLHGEIEEAPKPSPAKTTSTGGELMNSTSTTSQETRASNQNRCKKSSKHVAQFIPQLKEGNSINTAFSRKHQRPTEASDVFRHLQGSTGNREASVTVRIVGVAKMGCAECGTGNKAFLIHSGFDLQSSRRYVQYFQQPFCDHVLYIYKQCVLAADLWFFFGKRLQFHETTLHTGSGYLRRFSVNNNIGKFGDKLF
ncbi:hypothetical protein GEV33_006110 [Tenebrio molitor]|uniref:Uncharacterized protein n=1 Tax=Tenebrio molitor TaxID=7067 RepID=A0A8J6LKL8_TENMO|nr:hypothetical protein GEV33_006110 [Tenebrio molitor]